ncbi:MAG TPA: hypothetical protein PLM68_08250, partial [Bacteroidales bacterium]|nr:hypothetical protein [Bacteroidales bacterium]
IKYTNNIQNIIVLIYRSPHKFNGHAIGFYMSSQIVKAGFEDEMVINFYNPYKFYTLYNLAAKNNGTFLFCNEFMEFLKNRTEKYYH